MIGTFVAFIVGRQEVQLPTLPYRASHPSHFAIDLVFAVPPCPSVRLGIAVVSYAVVVASRARCLEVHNALHTTHCTMIDVQMLDHECNPEGLGVVKVAEGTHILGTPASFFLRAPI